MNDIDLNLIDKNDKNRIEKFGKFDLVYVEDETRKRSKSEFYARVKLRNKLQIEPIEFSILI